MLQTYVALVFDAHVFEALLLCEHEEVVIFQEWHVYSDIMTAILHAHN